MLTDSVHTLFFCHVCDTPWTVSFMQQDLPELPVEVHVTPSTECYVDSQVAMLHKTTLFADYEWCFVNGMVKGADQHSKRLKKEEMEVLKLNEGIPITDTLTEEALAGRTAAIRFSLTAGALPKPTASGECLLCMLQ